MPECLSDIELAAIAADQPLQRDRSVIDAHLSTCIRCRRRLELAQRKATASHTETVIVPSNHSGRESSPPPTTAHFASPSLALEGYDVIERVQGGAGGQGVVFKAMQKSTSRMVAVKILPHEETATARQKQRFEREVSLAASLRHPNIVTIYDSGLTSGRYYFAMEYIHGQPLDDFARTLDQRAKLALFAKVCDAVAHAHQQNVVHRDLKPANVLVDARGEPHVLDFGLAKTAGTALLAGEDAKLPVTLTSQFMGTLAYASPEQTMGDPMLVDRRSDVYSLGVILFEMLTGTFPYVLPGDLVGTFEAIRRSPPRKPSQTDGGSGIDRDLDTIVLRALAKEPARRYPSAEELATDVHRYLEGKAISARQDSVLYVSTIKAKAALRRHPALTALAVVIASAFLAKFVAEALLNAWPAPGQWFEYASGASGVQPADGAFDAVRIVPITEETEERIEQLAAEANLQGVTLDDWKSLRLAHGHLMERLAKAGVKAVVWDIEFPGETEYDADFAKGVTALRDKNAGVVVGILTWDVNDPAAPPIAPAILNARVHWGGTSLGVDNIAAWKVDLVVKHEGGTPLSSLALAALSAVRQPKMDVLTLLDEHSERVQLEYRAIDSRVLQASRAFESVTLSAVRVCNGTADEKHVGLQRGSIVGIYAMPLPPQQSLDDATRPYHEVFALNDDDLRAWCADRVLVFCDNRPDNDGNYDRHEAADSRWLWGGEGHAIAIDALLRDSVPARYPREWKYNAMIALAALAGLGLAWQRRVPRGLNAVAAIFAAVAAIGICIAAYRVTGYLFQPLALVFALLLAFAAWWWLDRMHTWRLQSERAI